MTIESVAALLLAASATLAAAELGCQAAKEATSTLASQASGLARYAADLSLSQVGFSASSVQQRESVSGGCASGESTASALTIKCNASDDGDSTDGADSDAP